MSSDVITIHSGKLAHSFPVPSSPRMPNLAHAICRLSSEIGTGTKAERAHYITAAPPARGEEREGPRARGQGANPQLSCLPAYSSHLRSRCGGFRGAAREDLEAQQGLQARGDPWARAGGQTTLLAPWLEGAW